PNHNPWKVCGIAAECSPVFMNTSVYRMWERTAVCLSFLWRIGICTWPGLFGNMETWGQTERSLISDLFLPPVDDFETVRSAELNRALQLSTRGLQQLQKQSLRNCKILQLSESLKIWFGTRGSEVQILSPRPIILHPNNP